MHYEITYTGTKREKYAKALLDARKYLGPAAYNRIMDALAAEWRTRKRGARSAYRYYMVSLGIMCGIEGVPARAMARAAIEGTR